MSASNNLFKTWAALRRWVVETEIALEKAAEGGPEPEELRRQLEVAREREASALASAKRAFAEELRARGLVE